MKPTPIVWTSSSTANLCHSGLTFYIRFWSAISNQMIKTNINNKNSNNLTKLCVIGTRSSPRLPLAALCYRNTWINCKLWLSAINFNKATEFPLLHFFFTSGSLVPTIQTMPWPQFRQLVGSRKKIMETPTCSSVMTSAQVTPLLQ